MQEVTIRNYIDRAKEITAAQIRRKPVGTKVILHSFDRYGTHQTREATVILSGKTKQLAFRDYWAGINEVKPIRKETDRFCYTES